MTKDKTQYLCDDIQEDSLTKGIKEVTNTNARK